MRWREIPGWEGRYAVSDTGLIKSLARVVGGYGGRRHARKARLLTPAPTMDGHMRVTLYRDGARHHRSVHRLVLLAFVGPCPEGMEGCHGNGDPGDNRLANLRWDTPSENARDVVRHGRNRFANRTHCPRGHEYTPENTAVRDGSRACRECARDRCRRWRAARREAAA